MKLNSTHADLRKLPVVLFMNVPIGAIIRFNGCLAEKLDAKHVRFITDCDGAPMDYSKRHNKRYARTTQQQIEGTPVRIVRAPKAKGTPAELIEQADALISEAKRASIDFPQVTEYLHAANLCLSDALATIERANAALASRSTL